MSEAKRAREKWSKAINFVCDDNSLSADYIEELEKENAKLRECVEFYANEDSWFSDSGVFTSKIKEEDIDSLDHDVIPELWKHVGGKKARETLKELEGGE